MRFAALSLAAVFFVGASAFRVKPKRRSRAAGQVDGVFPFASPGTAAPGLQNARGGPCFPGVRSAAVKQQWFGQEVDTVTTITGVVGFRHPWMDFKLVDMKNASKNRLYPCNDEVPNQPRGLSKIALHDRNGYAAAMRDMDLGWGDLMYYLTQIGIPQSYNQDRASANDAAQTFGWELIGSALSPGGQDYVGELVSHLFQDKSSKRCILTFQGSSSLEDWMANLNFDKVSFCGLAPASARAKDGVAVLAAGESLPVGASTKGGEPVVLAAGESLVHEGFKDTLMYMVNNSDWQSDVRPKLSTCSKVYVTGHSLGGAQAELFAACAQKAPGQGENGWEAYQYIGW